MKSKGSTSKRPQANSTKKIEKPANSSKKSPTPPKTVEQKKSTMADRIEIIKSICQEKSVSEALIKESLEQMGEIESEKYVRLFQKNLQMSKELSDLKKSVEAELQKPKASKPSHQNSSENQGKKFLSSKEIKDQEKDLRKHAEKIKELRSEIKRKKAELENTFQVELLRDKRNELTSLSKQLQELVSEKSLLEKISKDQEEFLSNNVESRVEESRCKELQEMLKRTKEEARTLTLTKSELENEVNKLHSEVMKEKQDIKNMKKQIQDKKTTKKNPAKETENITPQQAEVQIGNLKKQKEDVERQNEAELKILEKEKKDLNVENEKLEKLLKEKENEIKHNSIQLKNLRKAHKSNLMEAVQKKVKEQDESVEVKKESKEEIAKEDLVTPTKVEGEEEEGEPEKNFDEGFQEGDAVENGGIEE